MDRPLPMHHFHMLYFIRVSDYKSRSQFQHQHVCTFSVLALCSLLTMAIALPLSLSISASNSWSAESQKAPAVLVFGDSYGDTGNNNNISTLVKSNFPPYGRDFPRREPTGRFSNGRLMSDYFAVAGLGIKDLLPPYLDPNLQDEDLLTGVCFGSSGTGLDNLTADILSVIPFWRQIKYYKEYRARLAALTGQNRATEILNKTIFFITIGTNDFIANYYLVPLRRLQFTVSQYQDFLLQAYMGYLEELYSLDARRIGVINVPPLGCLPIERTLGFLQNGGSCVEEINKAASGFNNKLKSSINRVLKSNNELKIVSLDYYDLVLDAIQYPTKYGFEVVERGCCGTGTIEVSYLCKCTPLTCPDASKYVFFDSIHPTQKLYDIVSNVFLTRDIPQLLM